MAEDFQQWLSESANGRKSKFTTDEIVRSLIVLFLEGDSYRQAVIRIDGSEFLRRFVGIGVIYQTEKRILEGIILPATEKVYS